MEQVIVILFLSYVTFMYFGGLTGFIKSKPIKFSDKVDLFYIEPRNGKPRRRNSDAPSRNVRVRPVDGKSRSRRERECLVERLPKKSLPVRNPVNAKAKPSHGRTVATKPARSINRKVFEDCVAALKQLGYGTNAHCKSIVSKHVSGLSHKITSCESFLESFLKLERCNES